MYVEGQQQDDVESWVGIVKGLKYKDFQLVTRPQALSDENGSELRGRKSAESKSKQKKKAKEEPQEVVGLAEVETVKEFGNLMEKRGVWNWWRKGMGYAPE